MQLILETEPTVNIVDKMTSIDTMPVAESKPDSPQDVIKVSKSDSMETNNIKVDAVKPDENGIQKEINGDTNDTMMTESPETSDDVVHKDKENNTSAQNGNGDITITPTTAEIDTIDLVTTKDTEDAKVVPNSENLTQFKDIPLKMPENLEVTSDDLQKSENENEFKDITPSNGDDDVIKPEIVKENGDQTKINSEDNIDNSDTRENTALQPEILNENADLANRDNLTSASGTTKAQLDDKDLTEETTPEEERTLTADCEEKLSSIDSSGSTNRIRLEDSVTATDNALKEATDVIQDSNMEESDHGDSIKASDETRENKMEVNNENVIKSMKEAEENKIEATNHNVQIKATAEMQDSKMESSDHEDREKTSDGLLVNKLCEVADPDQEMKVDEKQENKVEVTDYVHEIKGIPDTQENNMEVTDEDEERKSSEITEENKIDSAESKVGTKPTDASYDNDMEVTEQEDRVTHTNKTQEKKIEVTNNEEPLKPTDELQENEKESRDPLNLSGETKKSDTLQCEKKIVKDNSIDSVLNVNSDSLDSNACDENILNSNEIQNSAKEIEENCVDNSKQIESDINIGSNVNKDTQNINVCNKNENSEVKDISENKIDSPQKVEEKEVKAAASEAMDVDASEDLKSDNPAVPNKIETTNDALFDKVLSEEIISVNSNKTVNLDSDRKSSPVTVIDCDEILDTGDETSQNAENEKSKPKENVPSRPKKSDSISRLSNTLDILSDDDDCVEECKEKLPEKPNSTDKENKCINLDEDDDVMLIDDSPNEKEVEEPKITEYMKTQECEAVKNEDDKHKSDQMNTINLDNDSEPEISKTSTKDDVCKETVADVPLGEDSKIKAPEIGEKLEKPVSPKPVHRPLIPENFLKAFKKNVVDMNRDELEEFCLMKIVEGIIDQTNLSEVKTKLKTMNSYIEEWKKKVTALTKQNRDLQIVLKTVQDEQKKRSEHQVVPLKITRSVGMQVYMAEVTDKGAAKRKAPQSTPVARNNRNPPSKPGGKQNSNTNTPIPVPRLVPAPPNNSPMKGRHPAQVQNATVTSNSPKQYVQNGIKTPSPAQKSEKRPFSSVQSVTVDLTDDEPPAKQPAPARNNAQAPVRLVAQQQLMKPRAQAGSGNPGARKVFIPINPQNNIRPGQTITLKSVPNARIRGPGSQNALPIRVQANAVRGPRPNMNLRHPAPLPEVAKQQQPPNWKALPPAPDLKISKVENGIVISWKIEGYQEDSYEEIASYQLYAYQETSSPPSTLLWKKIGDVKALPLPMACTLTQFMAGYKYYFAVRAVDIRSRIGTFSLPGSILLLNK